MSEQKPVAYLFDNGIGKSFFSADDYRPMGAYPLFTADQLKVEREKAIAEAEQYKKDAERYRWLRDESKPFEYLRNHDLPIGITLDTEVDRAMKNG